MPKLQALKSVQFMQVTRLQREEIRNYKRPNIASSSPFKSYPQAARIALPRDWKLEEARLTPLLQQRRSIRTFSNQPLTLRALSYMLWASQGITGKAGKSSFRTAPSAGALYPIETYISVQRVKGLESGIYHLDVPRLELEFLQPGDYADDFALSALNQPLLSNAAVVFIWTTIYRRNLSKYGDRGLRYICLDAGHICQNLLLAAEANGCGGCAVAAFFDDEINEILGIDGMEETAIYMAGIGIKKSTE